jgi:hypothetical protein
MHRRWILFADSADNNPGSAFEARIRNSAECPKGLIGFVAEISNATRPIAGCVLGGAEAPYLIAVQDWLIVKMLHSSIQKPDRRY